MGAAPVDHARAIGSWVNGANKPLMGKRISVGGGDSSVYSARGGGRVPAFGSRNRSVHVQSKLS